MKNLTITSLFLTAALAGGLSAQTPSWKVELLGAPDPTWTLTAVSAVNDAGQVVGNGYLSGWKRAWIAEAGQGVQLLPLPPDANWSEANDINASGVVAGSVLIAGASQGILWNPVPSGYEAFLLPSGPGGWTPFDAQGLNDAGDVVGKYGILGGSYVWNEATGITQIPSSTFPTVPYDVNEQRQIVGDSYRMDLDTLVLENLGSPTGTSYNYIYTELTCINDAGEAAGYAAAATSSSPFLAVRYSPLGWKLLNSFPLSSASVLGMAATGDVTHQLAYLGRWVYVNGFGSIALQSTLAAGYDDWDLSNTYMQTFSRGGLIATTGFNSTTGDGGVLLLTPLHFENLGGAARGALGDPVLNGFAELVPGSPTRLRLSSAAPNSLAIFAWATSSNPIPLYGGTFFATPTARLVSMRTDSVGRVDVTFPWPNAPVGADFYLQAAVLDPASTGGVAMSNGLKAVTR